MGVLFISFTFIFLVNINYKFFKISLTLKFSLKFLNFKFVYRCTYLSGIDILPLMVTLKDCKRKCSNLPMYVCWLTTLVWRIL